MRINQGNGNMIKNVLKINFLYKFCIIIIIIRFLLDIRYVSSNVSVGFLEITKQLIVLKKVLNSKCLEKL